MPPRTLAQQREARRKVLNQLRPMTVLAALDTGRGIVITVSDESFRGAALQDGVSPDLMRIVNVVTQNGGLRLSVEGYSDTSDKWVLSSERAETVRQALSRNGISASDISAAGLGDSRPVGPSATEQDRKKNSRVEIVIAGDPIGRLALWQEPLNISSEAANTDIGGPGK